MPPPPPPIIHTPIPALDEIDASLLDPSQAAILASLQRAHSGPDPTLSTPASNIESVPPSSTSTFTFTFTTPTALQTHLTKLTQSLEPNIDLFADGVHKIEQYRSTAERVADRVLGTAAKRLEERDKVGKEKVGSEGIGVGDVLRGLAGVLNES
jgi:kinetochore protein Mis13/DSN1